MQNKNANIYMHTFFHNFFLPQIKILSTSALKKTTRRIIGDGELLIFFSSVWRY